MSKNKIQTFSKTEKASLKRDSDFINIQNSTYVM